jgi:hypothetical protein
MLSFIKKLFGSKPAETPAPYKVEASTAKVGEFPFPETKPAKAVKTPAVKKPAVTAKTARKPRAPKA